MSGVQAIAFMGDVAPTAPKTETQIVRFEIFVSAGFNALEVSAVSGVLAQANDILGASAFEWRYVSDTPGLLTGSQGMIVRAEPAVANHDFSQVMIVSGGCRRKGTDWIARVRAMKRAGRTVVLLSEAATSFIEASGPTSGKVTAHWRDVLTLSEAGYYPNLTFNIAEKANGIITSAGNSSTLDLMIGLISDHLTGPQIAELSSHLLMSSIRKTSAEQPRNIGHNESLFDKRIAKAINLMEETISEPLPMVDLADHLGVSVRHLERQFNEVFSDTPARFYKRLRVKRAKAMLEETMMSIVDISVVTGFGSTQTLAKSMKDEYGLTPKKIRDRRTVKLVDF
ncbi:MAG: helix-turn-helix domain-containing protein [Amylibacter sp.]